MSEDADAIRVDVWLWRARFFKTRSLATKIVADGQVRLGHAGTVRRLTKASALVRPGDTLTLLVNRQIVQLEILDLGTRRGPASEARGLYRPIEADDPGTPET